MTIDKTKLRHEISGKADNSWVKAKKKLMIPDEDNYIGLKSLFHSLRILDFGLQIADAGRIVDYGAVNWLLKEILESGETDWDYFDKKYRGTKNAMRSDFKKLAPKE